MACFKVLSRYCGQGKATTESYDGVFRDWNQAPPKSEVPPAEPVFSFIILYAQIDESCVIVL
jgi:hypothetical protein